MRLILTQYGESVNPALFTAMSPFEHGKDNFSVQMEFADGRRRDLTKRIREVTALKVIKALHEFLTGSSNVQDVSLDLNAIVPMLMKEDP